MATLNAPVLLQASGLDYVLLDSGHGRKLEELGGVRVQPGDILFGDVDGVLVIPKAAEEEAIAEA